MVDTINTNLSLVDKILFDLSGERKVESRRSLYKFMLENMNDEQRFQTTFRLCQVNDTFSLLFTDWLTQINAMFISE